MYGTRGVLPINQECAHPVLRFYFCSSSWSIEDNGRRHVQNVYFIAVLSYSEVIQKTKNRIMIPRICQFFCQDLADGVHISLTHIHLRIRDKCIVLAVTQFIFLFFSNHCCLNSECNSPVISSSKQYSVLAKYWRGDCQPVCAPEGKVWRCYMFFLLSKKTEHKLFETYRPESLAYKSVPHCSLFAPFLNIFSSHTWAERQVG